MYYTKTTDIPLRFYHCGHLICNTDFLHQRRVLSCNVLILVLEGTLAIHSDGRDYLVPPAHFLFLKAGAEHYGTTTSEGMLSYLWVHFDEKEDWRPANGNAGPLPISDSSVSYRIPVFGKITDMGRMQILFRQMMDISRRRSDYTNAMADCALSLLLMELSAEYFLSLCTYNDEAAGMPDPSDRPDTPIAPIISWIRSNCHLDIHPDTVAEKFGYNKAYLSSLFKKETGFPLVRYINHCRIELAKELLVSRDISVKETAFSTGFRDEKYFHRTFKSETGMTPLQYKQAFPNRFVNNG